MKYVSSISGGQDSTAMTVRLLELGYKVDYIIFCDTGNEFDEMYDYIDKLDLYLQQRFNIGITRLSSKDTLESLVFSPFKRGKRKGQIRGIPYSSMMSFCTRDLKKIVADKFLKTLNDDVTQYIGYVFREKNRCHNSDKKFITHSYPLIDWCWNEPDVSRYLKQQTLYNPLYDNFSRTGCKFCPKQSLDSWYALYVHHRNDFEIAKECEERTKEVGALVKTFRSDYSMIQLEERFNRQLERDKNAPRFKLDWNDENVSCMCK